MTATSDHSSERMTHIRFDTHPAADKYEQALVGTGSDRREQRCLVRALEGVPTGARVLDLPCGTGRLLPLLLGMGYRVTAADASEHMIGRAKQFAEGRGLTGDGLDFHVAQVAGTDFEDGAFDAVVCNRLFHHFREADARRKGLAELGRICTGPIVVSFFRNHGVDAVYTHFKHLIRRRGPSDRIPISLRAFTADAASAGLALHRTLAKRPCISRQWYAVFGRCQHEP